ncbi:MAG: hypothetical protein ACFFCD_11540 [Promethearchaeota archaeon]
MSGVCEYLTELETKIVIGELALREIEKIYGLHEWEKKLSSESIRIILGEIMNETSSDDIEAKEGKIDILHYEKLLRFFEEILKDIVCENTLSYPDLSTKEECETAAESALNIVTEFSKENECSFQLSQEMLKKIENSVKNELGVVQKARVGRMKETEIINYNAILEEIKSELMDIGLNLAEKNHPILFAEKRSLIQKVLNKMLDRILDLDIKNAKKSIEYGYLEKDSKKIKDNIYKAAVRSLTWSIKEIFDDLLADYTS